MTPSVSSATDAALREIDRAIVAFLAQHPVGSARRVGDRGAVGWTEGRLWAWVDSGRVPADEVRA